MFTMLPQHLINIIYQYNPDHRELFQHSLNQIIDKCCCISCNSPCELNFCVTSNRQIFCSQSCMTFWINMRHDDHEFPEYIDEIVYEDDFENIEDDDDDDEYDDNEQFIYDYFD